MGTKLPLFGYVDPALYGEGNPVMSSVDKFLAHINRDDVKALKHSLICDDFDPEVDEWVRGTRRENIYEGRPELTQLIKLINKKGSIVAPTIEDLIRNQSRAMFKLLEQIILDLIPVLTIYHSKYPLSKFLDDPKPDAQVFDMMPRNSMANETRLKAVVQNMGRIRF